MPMNCQPTMSDRTASSRVSCDIQINQDRTICCISQIKLFLNSVINGETFKAILAMLYFPHRAFFQRIQLPPKLGAKTNMEVEEGSQHSQSCNGMRRQLSAQSF
jgi:hypothetical protein